MTSYLVHHFLEQSASKSPEQLFLIHGNERVTYGEVDAGANRLARLLQAGGIGRGDRVGLLAQNSRLYVESYYAILKAGAVAVPLNTATDGPALRHALSDCGARALMAGQRFDKPVGQAITGLPELNLLIIPDPARLASIPARIRAWPFSAAQQQPSSPPPVHVIDLDLASIVYTSGSTGKPRGAMLSHLNLVANTRAIVTYLALSPADRVLAILPFYYVYGKSLLNTHAAAGGTVVIENRFLYPATALDTLEHQACTGLAGVPSTYAILLNKTNFSTLPLPSLRYMTQAGGPMSPDLTRRLMAAKPGARLFVMYGATEASARLSYLEPDDLPAKVGSIGKALTNVDLRVLRENGTPCATDETGEIVARGSNIMSGYWGAPEETAQVLTSHGYHTGDLGRCDGDGFFWVIGRKKDIIKSGAHRIGAREIEDVILEFPDVHEAAVIGVPDEVLGEAIKACIVFRGDPTLAMVHLERFLRERLPAYKVPAVLEAFSELPKNESGKIMKRQLVAPAPSGAA